MFAQDIHSMPWHFQDRTSTKTHAVFITNEFGLTVACLIFNIESTLSTYIPDCDQKFVANIPSTILHTKRLNLFVLHPIPVPNRQAEDLIRRCPLCWMNLRQSFQSWTMRQRWIWWRSCPENFPDLFHHCNIMWFFISHRAGPSILHCTL